MKINAEDCRFASMSDNRRELIAIMSSLQISQVKLSVLLGVTPDSVNNWVRPERKTSSEPPFYALNFLRSLTLLSEISYSSLEMLSPLIDINSILADLTKDPKISREGIALLSAESREMVAMMAICRVNQSHLSRLLGIHSVTINRWVRSGREDTKVAPFHAINFMRAFYLLPEDKRLKLNSREPLVNIDAALKGEGVIFVR